MSTYDHPGTDTSSRVELHTPPAQSTTSGAWAWAGVLAGVLGLATFMVAPTAVENSQDLLADNTLVANALADSEGIIWAFQVITVATAALLVVFGAGVRRRLAEQEPVGSLLPTVAFSGSLLTAAMSLVGGGISTELFWYLVEDIDKSDPDTIASTFTIYNTIGWVWAGLGLTAGAVAIAALRHGSVQRWIGWVSVVLTTLILASQVVPLQYLALLPGSLWLVIAGLGFTRRERIG